MKIAKLLVVALVIFSSFPLLAQQANANAQQSTSTKTGGAQAATSTSANASATRTANGAQAQGSANNASSIAAPKMRAHNQPAASHPQPHGSAWNASSASLQPVNGELQNKLDSKSAKVGDAVVLKTTQAIRTADGTELPKGTRLIGHVTRVDRHRAKNDNGDLDIAFDRALLKSGRTVPVHSVIESVAPSPSAMALANAGNDDMLDGPMAGPVGGGSSAMGGSMIGGGRGIGGGGSLGGATALSSAPARTMNTSLDGAGSGAAYAGRNTLGSSGNLASGASASASNLRGSAAGSGLTAAHATAIPGVMLAGDTTGAASGTLMASRKNVHLDSGTQMVLGIAAEANR